MLDIELKENLLLRKRMKSDGDEKFVQEAVHQSKLPFYSKSFDTRKCATEQSVSIQMAARELRMEWFSSLCQQGGYDCIALAHHQDDQHETFFIFTFQIIHNLPVKCSTECNRYKRLRLTASKQC